jgi:hypothetical protein
MQKHCMQKHCMQKHQGSKVTFEVELAGVFVVVGLLFVVVGLLGPLPSA